jgi:hypothetical protein
VDRINSVIKLLRDEVKGRSKVSNKQIEEVCQLFYVYVPTPVKTLVMDKPGAETLRSSSRL